MFATITCLEQHDLGLVAWACVVCAVSAAISLGAYRRALRAKAARPAWIAVFALLLGSGVWATHFMAMLAFHTELRVAFAGGPTGLSWIAAIVGMGAGAALAAGRSWPWRLLGGVVCGAALGAMHFVGVAAMRLPATITWNPGLLAQAIGFGVAGAAAAFIVAGRLDRLGHWIAATFLIVIAILGLHFTGMAAATLIPNAGVITGEGLTSRPELTIAIAALGILIMAAGAGLVGMDKLSANSTLATMREALSCTPSPLAIYDASYRLVFWNHGYAALMQAWEVEPKVGMSLGDVLARGDDAAIVYARLLSNTGQAMAPFCSPDGRWRQPRLGRTVDGGLVHLLHDVTDEILAREAAEAASRAKSEFLANMSHEIACRPSNRANWA
jgi:NO-binding membrane sensor protein with MHYT domain